VQSKYYTTVKEDKVDATKKEDEIDNDPVAYSTSKASTHHINKSFGYTSRGTAKDQLRRLGLGTFLLIVLIYVGWIREDEKNDIFVVDLDKELAEDNAE